MRGKEREEREEVKERAKKPKEEGFFLSLKGPPPLHLPFPLRARGLFLGLPKRPLRCLIFSDATAKIDI